MLDKHPDLLVAHGNPIDPKIVISSQIYAAIMTSARITMPHETIGALVGHVRRSEGQEWITVSEVEPVSLVQGRVGNLVPNAHECKELRDRFSGGEGPHIAGWYYCDSGVGLFNARLDIAEVHREFGPDAALLLLVNPVSEQGGFYVWRDGRLVPVAGFYEAVLHPGALSAIPWGGEVQGAGDWLISALGPDTLATAATAPEATEEASPPETAPTTISDEATPEVEVISPAQLSPPAEAVEASAVPASARSYEDAATAMAPGVLYDGGPDGAVPDGGQPVVPEGAHSRDRVLETIPLALVPEAPPRGEAVEEEGTAAPVVEEIVVGGEALHEASEPLEFAARDDAAQWDALLRPVAIEEEAGGSKRSRRVALPAILGIALLTLVCLLGVAALIGRYTGSPAALLPASTPVSQALPLISETLVRTPEAAPSTVMDAPTPVEAIGQPEPANTPPPAPTPPPPAPSPTIAPPSPTANPPSPTSGPVPAEAVLRQVVEVEAALRSGQLEATTSSGSTARLRFDLGSEGRPPRFHLVSTFSGPSGVQTTEQITIGEQSWLRQPDGRWSAAPELEGAWGQVRAYLPQVASVAGPAVETAGEVTLLRWHDSGLNAGITLQVDPDTGVPLRLQRVSRSGGPTLTVVYSAWNTPVEVTPPDNP